MVELVQIGNVKLCNIIILLLVTWHPTNWKVLTV